jgi:hypothetical protein
MYWCCNLPITPRPPSIITKYDASLLACFTEDINWNRIFIYISCYTCDNCYICDNCYTCDNYYTCDNWFDFWSQLKQYICTIVKSKTVNL